MLCPCCKSEGAYVGFLSVQCTQLDCKNYDANFTGCWPDKKPAMQNPQSESWDDVLPMPDAPPTSIGPSSLLEKINWDDAWLHAQPGYITREYNTLAHNMTYRCAPLNPGGVHPSMVGIPWEAITPIVLDNLVQRIRSGYMWSLTGRRYSSTAKG